MKRSTRVTASAVTLAFAASPVVVAPVAAQADTCWKREDVVKTTKGRDVWIPGSLVTPWTSGGGSIDVSWTKGEDYSKTKGSADTVAVSGGVNVGIYEASAEYNHEWNRSTTTSTSRTITLNRSWDVPEKGRWRIRWYHRGREFKATKTRYYGNCPSATVTKVVRVPLKRNSLANRLIALEKYSKRNQFRY